MGLQAEATRNVVLRAWTFGVGKEGSCVGELNESPLVQKSGNIARAACLLHVVSNYNNSMLGF